MLTFQTEEKNGSVNGLKAANLRNIMSSLLSNGPQTKMDLLLSTHLSASTVSDLIKRLLAGGILDECGSEQSSGGRRPVIYQIRPQACSMVGLCMESDRVMTTITDLVGTPLESFAIPHHKSDALTALHQALDQCIQHDASIHAIGIGLKGQVDWKHGLVLQDRDCGWQNVPLKELVERRHGVFTCVDHRVNARAIAESYIGSAKEMQHFACLYQDAPEKAALVLDGKLLHGSHGTTGRMHARSERWLSVLDIDTVITDRTDLTEVKVVPAKLTGPDFSGDCAMMAEIYWLDTLYDFLKEAMV